MTETGPWTNRSRGRDGFDQGLERGTTEVLFRDLRSEAFRLVSQPQQSHEGFHSRDLPAASTDAGGYAAAQARTPHAGGLRACSSEAGRLPASTAGYCHDRGSAHFQLHLVDQGTSQITLNATITGLKFFFDVALDRSELMSKMKPVFVPRTLPVVLSREEVSSLIAATKKLKHQTTLSIAYGAGLRANDTSLPHSRMVRVLRGAA